MLNIMVAGIHEQFEFKVRKVMEGRDLEVDFPNFEETFGKDSSVSLELQSGETPLFVVNEIDLSTVRV